jgi:hypothetical protein
MNTKHILTYDIGSQGHCGWCTDNECDLVLYRAIITTSEENPSIKHFKRSIETALPSLPWCDCFGGYCQDSFRAPAWMSGSRATYEYNLASHEKVPSEDKVSTTIKVEKVI